MNNAIRYNVSVLHTDDVDPLLADKEFDHSLIMMLHALFAELCVKETNKRGRKTKRLKHS